MGAAAAAAATAWGAPSNPHPLTANGDIGAGAAVVGAAVA